MTDPERPEIRLIREELQVDFETLADNARELALSYLASWRLRFGDVAGSAVLTQQYPALAPDGGLYGLSSSHPENFSLISENESGERTRYVFSEDVLSVALEDSEELTPVEEPPLKLQHWNMLSGILYTCDAVERDRRSSGEGV